MRAALRRITGLLAAAAFAALLSACAQGPSSTPAARDAQPELSTASDETPVRRRARLRLELASAYFQQGQTYVALDEAKQALALDPAYADAYSLRGLAYLRLNEITLAEQSFKKALDLAPQDPDAAHNLGWLACQQGRQDDAARLFAQAIASPVYAGAARTWLAQGLCQLRAGQPLQAELSLTRSHQLDAGNAITTYNLARLLFERGHYAGAQPYAHQLNTGPSANAETLWLGIRIERQLNNPGGVAVLVQQLRTRFAQSRELTDYDTGAFQ